MIDALRLLKFYNDDAAALKKGLQYAVDKFFIMNLIYTYENKQKVFEAMILRCARAAI